MFTRLAPEQHDTLDGIPEPSENSRLVGHAAVAGQLAAAYRTGKLPHAMLFSGPQGIGKATAAYHLAYHLLRHPDHRTAPDMLEVPDPGSSLFRQIASGAHPSVLHLTRPQAERAGSGFKSALTVDEVRKVGRFVSHTSHDGSYRVVIVDPADDMNINAANALLKNLEEPPSRTVFILIAHALGRLLPTIRSRCQVVRFTPLVDVELISVLEGFDIGLPQDETARRQLVMDAGGSARTAILLSQYGGLDIGQALDRLVRSAGTPGSEAHRLAEAVTGKDRAVQFALFNDRVLEILSDAATAAAREARLARAERISSAWQEMRIAIGEAETYNLDRKQHALNMILRLHDTLRM